MMVCVNTIDETRRTRLEMLIKQHGGLLANLNEALGLERTHSQLARIRNRNVRKDRPGKFFEMGDDQARTIEEKLGLPVGWMDTPPSYAELAGQDDPRQALWTVAENMSARELYQAVAVLTALKSATPGSSGATFTPSIAVVHETEQLVISQSKTTSEVAPTISSEDKAQSSNQKLKKPNENRLKRIARGLANAQAFALAQATAEMNQGRYRSKQQTAFALGIAPDIRDPIDRSVVVVIAPSSVKARVKPTPVKKLTNHPRIRSNSIHKKNTMDE